MKRNLKREREIATAQPARKWRSYPRGDKKAPRLTATDIAKWVRRTEKERKELEAAKKLGVDLNA